MLPARPASIGEHCCLHCRSTVARTALLRWPSGRAGRRSGRRRGAKHGGWGRPREVKDGCTLPEMQAWASGVARLPGSGSVHMRSCLLPYAPHRAQVNIQQRQPGSREQPAGGCAGLPRPGSCAAPLQAVALGLPWLGCLSAPVLPCSFNALHARGAGQALSALVPTAQPPCSAFRAI